MGPRGGAQVRHPCPFLSIPVLSYRVPPLLPPPSMRRFEREDNEADYEKACQRIRESTKYAPAPTYHSSEHCLACSLSMSIAVPCPIQARGFAAALRVGAGPAGEDPALLPHLPLQVLLRRRQGMHVLFPKRSPHSPDGDGDGDGDGNRIAPASAYGRALWIPASAVLAVEAVSAAVAPHADGVRAHLRNREAAEQGSSPRATVDACAADESWWGSLHRRLTSNKIPARRAWSRRTSCSSSARTWPGTPG